MSNNKSSTLSIVKKNKWNYIFLIPATVLYCIFTLYPIYNVFSYSFYNWEGYGPLVDFVGLDNYIEAISDPYYWNAIKNTITFAASHLVLQTSIALLFAIILNGTKSSGKKLYRLMIFIPVITTTSVMGLVMRMILDPVNGPINTILLNLGVISAPIVFLSSQTLTLPSVIAISLWKNIGVSLVYWLAALQTVPSDVYESAKIDGANAFQVFTRITLPIVAPFGAVIALFAFKNGLYPFDIVKTMTNGGPAFASDVVDTYIYRYAFSPEDSITRYGFSAAAGIFFAFLIVIIVKFATYLSNKVQD